jgi:hypothetical protein
VAWTSGVMDATRTLSRKARRDFADNAQPSIGKNSD